MIFAMLRLIAACFLLCLAVFLPGASTVPVSTTLVKGSDANFTCSGTWVDWRKYPRDPDLLYSPPSRDNVAITETNKYRIDGQYNLIVMNIDPATDAATYGCTSANAPRVENKANLVIIDEDLSGIKMNQDALSTGQINVAVGDNVNFTCTLRYGSPATGSLAALLLDKDQIPKLTMTLGVATLTGTEDVQPLTESAGIRIKTLTVSHTVVNDDGGKNLKCTVTSLTYVKDFIRQLLIPGQQYAPNTPTLSVSTTLTGSTLTANVAAGQTVTCSADGIPAPSVQWSTTTPGLSAPVATTSSAVLTIQASPSSQTWTCKATNTKGTSPPITVKFNVTGSSINPTVITGQDSTGGSEPIRNTFIVAVLSLLFAGLVQQLH